ASRIRRDGIYKHTWRYFALGVSADHIESVRTGSGEPEVAVRYGKRVRGSAGSRGDHSQEKSNEQFLHVRILASVYFLWLPIFVDQPIGISGTSAGRVTSLPLAVTSVTDDSPLSAAFRRMLSTRSPPVCTA